MHKQDRKKRRAQAGSTDPAAEARREPDGSEYDSD